MNECRNGATTQVHKRHKWQVSLRALFMLVAACAVVAWWYGRPEVIEEFYPDGRPRSRAEVIRMPDDALVKNGRWTFWDEAGQLRVAGPYRGGKPDGLWRYWHANGRVSAEGHYANGKMHGRWTQSDERGRKRFEGEYDQGRLHGPASAWWDNGYLASQGEYNAAGNRAGDWVYWDREGTRNQ